ncbi:uncharacterized protein yc1106_06381 [Curvularia clavata]|uniref:Uncharacterized protein n=1 Tax=Curvularia clavata TaxID=95742 RepID=A0A9Q8Z9R8_CURCL|nr:uncharacterized protein yc1106_06381 [Curvularia clavata]
MAPLRLAHQLATGKLPTTSAFKAFQHSLERAGAWLIKARPLQHSATPVRNAHTKPTPPFPTPGQQSGNPSLPSFNLFHHLQEAHPGIRYTVYAGLGLMVTVESTFWFHVLRAKFFPRALEADRQQDDELLNRLKSAVAGYRVVWMKNYQRYYGAHMWGLDYGGLDGLEDVNSSLL